MSLPTLHIAEDVVFEVFDGEAVVLDLKRGTYFRLNESGTRFWHLVEEHGDLAQIRQSMLAEFDVQPATLEADLAELISRLKDAGLITVDGDS